MMDIDCAILLLISVKDNLTYQRNNQGIAVFSCGGDLYTHIENSRGFNQLY